MTYLRIKIGLEVTVMVLILAGCTGIPNASEIAIGKTPIPGTYSPGPIGPIPDIPFITSTSSATPLSSLPTEDVDLLLSELLQNNGGCQLPCWWGIIPGQSTALDAQTEWAPLLRAADYSNLSATADGNMGFRSRASDPSIFIDLAYTVSTENQSIESIRVTTQASRRIAAGYEDVYDAASYKDMLGAWTLPKLLSVYGPPDQVVLSMEIIRAEPPFSDLFRIWLLYPEYGAIVRYSGPAEVVGGTIQICPMNTFVDLWLVPQGEAETYQKTLSGLTGHWDGLVPTTPYFKPVAEATGKTLQEFYHTFIQPTEICLETPLAIWPLH